MTHHTINPDHNTVEGNEPIICMGDLQDGRHFRLFDHQHDYHARGFTMQWHLRIWTDTFAYTDEWFSYRHSAEVRVAQLLDPATTRQTPAPVDDGITRYTLDEIVAKVRNFHRGCSDGKNEFLRDEFNWNPISAWVGTYRVTLMVDYRLNENFDWEPSEEDDDPSAAVALRVRDENITDTVGGLDYVQTYDYSAEFLG